MERPPLSEKKKEPKEEWRDMRENDEIESNEQAFLEGYNRTKKKELEEKE